MTTMREPRNEVDTAVSVLRDVLARADSESASAYVPLVSVGRRDLRLVLDALGALQTVVQRTLDGIGQMEPVGEDWTRVHLRRGDLLALREVAARGRGAQAVMLLKQASDMERLVLQWWMDGGADSDGPEHEPLRVWCAAQIDDMLAASAGGELQP